MVRKSQPGKLKVVGARIDPAIERRLRLLAETTGQRPSFFLQQLIEGGMAALEERWLPAHVLMQVRAGVLPVAADLAPRAAPDLFEDAPDAG